MSKRKLEVGELGTVSMNERRGKRYADAYTRDSTGKLRRLSVLAASEEEALPLLERKARALSYAPDVLSPTSSLSDLLGAWHADVVMGRDIRPQSKRMYQTKINLLGSRYGEIALEDLRPARVNKIVQDIAQRAPLHESQVLKSTLNQALRYAVLSEALEYNPMLALDPLSKKKHRKKNTALTVTQIAVFRDTFAEYVAKQRRMANNRRNAQLIVDIIIGLGGLRISESVGFRRCDVDFEAGLVDLN
ncbi:MAG: hypothetical protein ACTHXP_07500, partial [Agrococcus casei]